MKQYLVLPFYVADVFRYVMTGPPLVYQSSSVLYGMSSVRLANLTELMPYSTLEDSDRQGEDRS